MDGMIRNNTIDEDSELRRGPWALEEDKILIRYITCHGEGRWNMLARSSGLKRTGKSCRLRWLNYLKPDVKRGNLTPEEQLLILELHSKWGNRWSRIAQYLPGRTDNEIKNYWRTRVQKQARQLQCDANSQKFQETFRCFWFPRLSQQTRSNSYISGTATSTTQQAIESSNQPSISPLSTEGINKASTVSFQGCYYEKPLDPHNFILDVQLPTIPQIQTSPHISRSCYYLDCYESYSPFNSMPASSWNHATFDCSLAENQWVNDMSDALWNLDECTSATQNQNSI